MGWDGIADGNGMGCISQSGRVIPFQLPHFSLSWQQEMNTTVEEGVAEGDTGPLGRLSMCNIDTNMEVSSHPIRTATRDGHPPDGSLPYPSSSWYVCTCHVFIFDINYVATLSTSYRS